MFGLPYFMFSVLVEIQNKVENYGVCIARQAKKNLPRLQLDKGCGVGIFALIGTETNRVW